METTVSGKKRRALVIDDDEGIRMVVARTLVRDGWSVETATTGREGLRALLTGIFDITIVDIRMAEMDGLTFIKEAKKIWPWQGIILISGHLDDVSIAKARQEGVRHFLQKPLNFTALLEAARDEVDQRSALDRATPPGTNPRDFINFQLGLMSHMSSHVLTGRNVLTALTSLGQALTGMLTFDVMGILGVDHDDEPILLLQCVRPMPSAMADSLREQIIARYLALTGKSLNEGQLHIEKAGPWQESADAPPLGSVACVPVITGDQVLGLLTIAATGENAFDAMIMALLYHTAGMLSTTLAAIGELRSLAIRDALTGLYNRRHLDEELARNWRLANRYKHPMAVLMLDVDYFKPVNDQHGHHAGDTVLKEFVRAIETHVRGSDVLARYGGDEFALILPYANRLEARGLAQRILETVRTMRFLSEAGGISLTTSIGIALHEPEHPVISYQELLQQADAALYRAKEEGRNRMAFADQLKPAADISIATIPPGSARRGHILLLDDEPAILAVLSRLLTKAGFIIETAPTIQACMEVIKNRREHFDILLCDLTLPDGHGLDMIRWARDLEPDMVSIIITGNATTENAIKSLQEGAYDFITKPVMRDVMLASIDRALAYRGLLLENRRYREHLEDMVHAKHNELATALENIKRSYEFSLETMVAMLDAREFETGQHSLRVRDLTIALARYMGYEGDALDELGRGALLHDIGKIAVPDAVLLKPGTLTPEDWAVIRRHPETGYRFVKNSDYLRTAAELVRSHHEAWDGSGYPQGLKGEAIPPGARIFAVIDAYDAMRSPRVYKTSISAKVALAEIKQKAGTQFDPHVVSAFESCLAEIERIGAWPP